ncbi:EamA family transporter [Kitasatospora viridis]|uniref:Putative blue pigment (Indigoidine) exporter n=1 Tax=Kitasatospora viridis TaxID=281105 RepID=A0A561UI58_9ACTN|nr:EamA family transporter [Kitasatospora viridis]TWF99052.1 putative blue pigment (indigoidine) exporter [Kitasatospora viridis]
MGGGRADTGRTGRIGVAAAAALAPASWGTTYLVTTQLLPEGRPMLAAVMRALPAGLLLLLLGRRLPKGRWWGRAIVLGMLNIGLFFPLIFIGAYRLPGGVAATIGALQPLLVTGFSVGVLKVRPSLRAVLAGLVGAGGVALLVLKSGARLDPTGLVAMVIAIVLMAMGTVLTRRWGRPEGATMLDLTAWQLVVGGIFLVPVATISEGMPPAPTTDNVIGFAYLGLVGTALAYALWFRGIERLGAGPASFLGLVNPLVATAGGIIVLHQTLTTWQVLGLVLALGAMLAGQGTGRKSAAAKAATAQAAAVSSAAQTAPEAPGVPTAPEGAVESQAAERAPLVRAAHGARREGINA